MTELLKKRKKALKDNNETGLISVCTDLANLYMEENKYDFAIEEYKLVANIHKKHNKQLEYAIVNRGIGEAYLGLQEFVKALHHQKIYLDITRQLKNKLEEQRALATIGHTYLSSFLESPELDKTNLDLANKFFKKSLVVSQSLNGEASKIEIADMLARLFSNLGVVQDCLGNFQQASELITKSINLCKQHDLYEQLQRGYNSLASILIKKGNYKEALQQYNLAVEAAKKTRNKATLLGGILLSKSEILVKLGDLQGAKNALLKAYKLKISDVKERGTIENHLRTVTSMCYLEDKLLITDSSDYKSLKNLYEKMGDGACDLRQYEKALEYYKKMLDSALKGEMNESELSSCYYSLAETYKDNGQFTEAIEYFEKELKLCPQLKDSLNTLSKIADTKEAADAPISEIQAIYNKAIELCQLEENTHEEGRMLKRFILYLRRQNQHSEAFQIEQKLSNLDYHSSDSESETSETTNQQAIGADIDLDAITDISDDSDLDQESTTKPRRRTKNFQIKRNVKGETQLHTACIKGQLNVVSHLLEQGHPINIRDNCGWLPLHEACINGHIQVVELLLEKGAAINDRGGTQCEGVTPMHDAASNGHLNILQLLLNKGANPLAKTDNGDTVLDYLKKWRSTIQLDGSNERLYEQICEEISTRLVKTGHVINPQPIQDRNECSALVSLIDDDIYKPCRVMEKSPINEDHRRSTMIGLEDDNSRNSPKKQTCDYREAIESLRYRSVKLNQNKLSTIKRPALLSENYVVDDWLEDDIGQKFKKRKTNSPKSDDFQMLIDDELYSEPTTSQKSKTPEKNIRKKQMKLTNFGHTRTIVEPDSTSSPKLTSPVKFSRTQSFEQIIEPTLSIDVRINNKLYRVPILVSEISNHKIKWLAEEAAARYAKKEYMLPTLELETKTGAILADDDPVSLLFPMGNTQSEQVEGRIIKWNVPPLIDRYREACLDMSIDTNETICRILHETSVNLNLSNQGLKGGSLSPLCKVLNRQNTLLELDFSGNFLTNECFYFLAASLVSLENLYRLNLSCTNLKHEHLQFLINNLSVDVVYKLNDLDLSDNLIGDQSFEYLSILTQRFQLKRLNLSGNKFTRNILKSSFYTNLSWKLDEIEDLNLSDNDLGNEALITILSWLKFRNLKSLNVSRNSVSEGFIREVLNNWNEIGELQICRISRCCVNDSDLFDLLRLTNSLEILDISYNNDLTSISLRRLLESKIPYLYLYGCKNILEYFTNFSKYCDDNSSQQTKMLKLSLPEDCETEKMFLLKMWQDFYGDRNLIELNYNFLSLSIKQSL